MEEDQEERALSSYFSLLRSLWKLNCLIAMAMS
jgi:hypothetical protein